MIEFANLPKWAQTKILVYLERNDFPAAKELRDYCVTISKEKVVKKTNQTDGIFINKNLMCLIINLALN